MREKKQFEIHSLSAIEHLLTYKPERILDLSVLTGFTPSARMQVILTQAKDLGIKIKNHNPTANRDAPPLLAYLRPYTPLDLKGLIASDATFVLLLDHLQDPQNFGAILRTAEGLGVDAVVIPRERSVSITPAVYHSSAGAVETVSVVEVANIGETIRRLKDNQFWVVGSTLSEGATPLEKVPHLDKIALVMGSEGDGISPLVEKLCDWKVYIPMKGKVQSLNVSASAAILMYAFQEKRRCAPAQG